jgi:hypothetical protein
MSGTRTCYLLSSHLSKLPDSWQLCPGSFLVRICPISVLAGHMQPKSLSTGILVLLHWSVNNPCRLVFFRYVWNHRQNQSRCASNCSSLTSDLRHASILELIEFVNRLNCNYLSVLFRFSDNNYYHLRSGRNNCLQHLPLWGHTTQPSLLTCFLFLQWFHRIICWWFLIYPNLCQNDSVNFGSYR